MTSNIRPFGLTVIHNPPETATVDIVLVHGLGGHPKATWTSDTGTFWPADLLPHALGQSRVRVLTYGYEASVENFTDGNRSAGIHDIAENLVSSLTANRNLRGCPERPIVFICHSLGGIVVKKALIYSRSVSNERVKYLRSVSVSTYGLIFLGTPHNVDDDGQWSMALHMQCEAVLPQQLVLSSPQLIKTLSENNETIRGTNSLFADLWNKFHVCFFYETKGISLEGYKYVVVDERSAAPIIEGTERAGIAADHIHMCKFDDASATYWKFMAGILSRYCIEAPHVIETQWIQERQERHIQEETKSEEFAPSIEVKPHEQIIGMQHNVPVPRLLQEQHFLWDVQQNLEPQPLFVVPPGFLPNKTFFGRQKELEILHYRFFNVKRRESSPSCILISGQPGSGKTHLARQYTWDCRNDYPGGIFWIDATSHQSMLTCIKGVTSAMLLDENERATKRGKTSTFDSQDPVVFRECLSTREGWLLVFDGLIFDNDKELSDFNQFLIPNKRCNILYTSEDETLSKKQQLFVPYCVRMPPLQIEDACKMLFRELGIRSPTTEQREKAKEIALHYDCLPGPIHSVGLEIHATGGPFEGFQLNSHLSDPEVRQPFLNNVLSLRRRNHRGANELLNLISFLDHTIPVSLIEMGASSLARIRSGQGGNIDEPLGILVHCGVIGIEFKPPDAPTPNEAQKSRRSFSRSTSAKPDKPTLVERVGRIFRGRGKNSPKIRETSKNSSKITTMGEDGIYLDPLITTDIITMDKDVQAFCRDGLRAEDKNRNGGSPRGDVAGIYDTLLIRATKFLCKSFENLRRQAPSEFIIAVNHPMYMSNAKALAGNFPKDLSSAPATVKEAHKNLNLLMHYISFSKETETQPRGSIYHWSKEPSSPGLSFLDVEVEAVPSAEGLNRIDSRASNASREDIPHVSDEDRIDSGTVEEDLDEDDTSLDSNTTNVPPPEKPKTPNFSEKHKGGNYHSSEASISDNLQSPPASGEKFEPKSTVESVSQYVSDQIFSKRASPTLDTEPITISQKVEVQTIYSDASTIDPFIKDAYIQELANLLLNEVYQYRTDSNSINRVATALPGCLKAFSLRFGFTRTSKIHRDIMTFIHKHRRDITDAFVDGSGESQYRPDDVSHSGNMSLTELMDLWRKHDQGPMDEDIQDQHIERDWEESESVNAPSTPILDNSDGYDREDIDLPELRKYRDSIIETAAYKWLLTDLGKHCFLIPSDPDVMTEIRQKILQSLPTTQRFSRREPSASYKMTYNVDWDPLSFLKNQGYKGEPSEAVATAITLTGSANTTQALTSSQYLEQTWPSSAPLVLEIVQQALRSQRGDHATGELSDGTEFTIWIETPNPSGKNTLLVEVIGTPYSVAEIGEQMAWIGASLRSSPYQGVAFSRPMVDNIRVIQGKGKAPAKDYLAELQSDIGFQVYSKQPSEANGLCWHGLFRNPVVVEGFPILRRPDERTVSGLEVPLYIMAGLAQARYVNTFMGRVYVKGFSTMLVPTEQCDDMTMWHLVHNRNGDRISYLDSPVIPTEQATIPQLEKARHVLGWCSEAKYLAGTSDISYQIAGSRLPKPRDDCILDQTSVSSGQMIVGGVPFAVGYKDTPFHISRGGYIRKLKWIFKKSVVIWDEGEKRGWLINGTSALLHLVCASLVHDSKDEFSSEFLFRWEDLQKAPVPFSNKPHAAISVLLNHTNRRLKIYPEKDDFIRFEDRVEHFMNILEQIIDHQVLAAGPDGNLYKSKRIPRAHLEGWDFHDLSSDIDPVYPRVATLRTMGKGWVDFVRSIPAITLLGRGFGDLLQPDNVSCTHWASLPRDKYYLAAGIADLEEIMDSSGDKTMYPIRLTENLTWHNLETAFAPCECVSGHEKHLDVVQVILPPTVLDESGVPRSPVDLEESGAVVFGYNENIQWCWDDHGDPEKGSLEYFDNQSSFKESDRGNHLTVLSSETATDSAQVSRATSPSMEDLVEEPRDVISNRLEPLTKSYTKWKLEGLVAEDYSIGIVCALPLELLAVRALFDMTHPDIHVAAADSNHYALGNMGRHKVVAACLPDGEYGTNSAADVASNLRRTFPAVKFCLLVGIGGGVPSSRNDIRLGDVVVSKPIGTNPGVMQYDMGKALENGIFEQQGFLQPPPRLVMTALSNLKSDPHLSRTPLQGYIEEIAACRREYRYPGAEQDRLFVSEFAHDPRYPTCDRCNLSHQCRRPGRPDTHPRIHYGLIASGNRVVKDARLRDQWSREKNVLCFEMEAAGIVNTLPCLVVRGICDYSDSHKNKRFQEYAAATAASYAKLLLSYMKETNDLEGVLRPPKMDETALLNVFRRGFSFLAWGNA